MFSPVKTYCSHSGASGTIGRACATAGKVRSANALIAVAEAAKNVLCLVMAGVLTVVSRRRFDAAADAIE
jgi:hypothetical protein